MRTHTTCKSVRLNTLYISGVLSAFVQKLLDCSSFVTSQTPLRNCRLLLIVQKFNLTVCATLFLKKKRSFPFRNLVHLFCSALDEPPLFFFFFHVQVPQSTSSMYNLSFPIISSSLIILSPLPKSFIFIHYLLVMFHPSVPFLDPL